MAPTAAATQRRSRSPRGHPPRSCRDSAAAPACAAQRLAHEVGPRIRQFHDQDRGDHGHQTQAIGQTRFASESAAQRQASVADARTCPRPPLAGTGPAARYRDTVPRRTEPASATTRPIRIQRAFPRGRMLGFSEPTTTGTRERTAAAGTRPAGSPGRPWPGRLCSKQPVDLVAGQQDRPAGQGAPARCRDGPHCTGHPARAAATAGIRIAAAAVRAPAKHNRGPPVYAFRPPKRRSRRAKSRIASCRSST